MIIDEVTLSSWDDVMSTYVKYSESDETADHWVFRGCADSKWKLQSLLERVCQQLQIHPGEREDRERGILRRFKRQYQIYGLESPSDEDVIEWLSLMQHYGAPTRLIDFSHSYFVALFFALEDLNDTRRRPALYAINQEKLDEMFKNKYPDLSAYFKKGRNSWTYESFENALGTSTPFVRSINPYRLNDRLIVQQGLFLCPGDVKSSFEDNLENVFGAHPSKSLCVKYILDFNVPTWKLALRQLEKMNMIASTLFPGLAGFAKSLQTHMASKIDIFPPDPEIDPRRRKTGIENGSRSWGTHR